MRFGLNELCLGVVTTCVVTTAAWAQSPVLDDQNKETTGTPTEAQLDPTLNQTPTENPVQYGAGIRIRNVRVPQSILELFVDRAAGGASSLGLGVDLVRRRGTVELQLGFEFEHLQVGEGVWINRGERVPTDEADYILSPEHAPENSELGWFTIEFTFLNHSEINKNFSIRYGGGAGLGILTGDLYHYDVICAGNATNANPEPGCIPSQRGGTGSGSGPVKYDLPPVFPVVNAIIGVQIKPIDKMYINIEGGIRTAPFFGASAGYFFN
jgi:hypothetical protein